MNKNFDEMNGFEKVFDTFEKCNNTLEEDQKLWDGMTKEQIEETLRRYSNCLSEPMDHIEERAELMCEYLNLEEEARKRITAGINQYSSPRELIPEGSKGYE